MKIVCDSCSTKYSIADEKVRGKVFKIKCKKCSHVIVVKGTEGAADPAAAPAPDKETSVFEYGKAEGGAAAAGGADAVWYLVVDREQVGPLTVAEVEDKYRRGDVDAETYGWREGFSDWLRIAAIPEFGAFAGGETGQTGRSDPSDLFGGKAKGDDEPAGDLFGGRASTTMPSQDTDVGVFAAAAGGGTPARRTVAKEDLFGGGGGHNGGGSAGGELGGEVKQMTAQRNENSVLFSLKNLTDLASTGKPSGGGGGGGAGAASAMPKSAFTSGGGEGSSGLIDIRAMAATVGVGGARPVSSSSSHSDDDLPVFSAASFGSPSAGMLLPTMSTPEKSNKLLFALIGVVGLLAIAAIVMVVVVLKGNKEAPAAQPAAMAGTPTPTDGKAGMAGATAGTPGAMDGTPAATPPKPAGDTAMAAATPDEVKKPDDKGDREAVKKPRTGSTKPPRETATAKPATRVEEPAPRPAATKKPACDEVACLVDSSLPCCGGGGGGGGGGSAPAPKSDLPDQLDRSSIQSGIASVRGRVQSCNDKYKVAGQVNVRFVVAPSGSVESATVSGKFAGSPSGDCVESAIQAARFKKAQSKTVVNNYPFIFK